MNLQDFLNKFDQSNEFDRHNKFNFKLVSPGHIHYEYIGQKFHQSAPTFIHGGTLSALMDSLLGMAALTQAVTENNLTSTVEFKINYLHPVQVGDELYAESKLTFNGKSLMVAQGEVRLKSNQKIVAIGIGTFNKYPYDKKKDLLNNV